MSSIDEKIIEYLRWHPNAKPLEIASYLGASIWIVRSALARLRERGIVVKTDRGYMLRAELGASRAAEVNRESSVESVGGISTGAGEVVTDVEIATSSILELSNRISILEKRIEEIESALGELKTRTEHLARRSQEAGYTGILNMITEALDVIKIALQAIFIGDRNSLNTALEDLENIIYSLREKAAASSKSEEQGSRQ